MTSAVVTLLGLVSVVSVQVDESPPAASPAPEEALLVVVERAHGATASPEAIRRAIAEELKRPVVGPTDAAGKSATQMLVVTLAPDSVTIQMRAAGDATARRHVQPVTTGESSLRVVAWLAGNLARDQASELMDAMPPAASAPPPRALDPAPAVAIEPPPATLAPAAVATTAPATAQAQAGDAPWRIEVSVGRSTFFGESNWRPNWPSLRSTRVEILAPSRSGSWSGTAGLEIFDWSQNSRTYVALAGFVRRFALLPGWLAADVAVGGGLGLTRLTWSQQRSDGTFDLTTLTRGPNWVGQLTGTLAFVRLRVGEIVAGVRIHEYADFWTQPTITFCAGLRVALP